MKVYAIEGKEARRQPALAMAHRQGALMRTFQHALRASQASGDCLV